ncbi:MAG: alpha-keto acid decarboxylase family protein [Candidatus Nitrosocosmicus sp.]
MIKNTDSKTVGEYLIDKLYDYGVRHIFGVPGDYILGFYEQLCKSKKVKIINTCDEQGAGFAADAYARINGIGVVCITYCVGGLKVVNSTAQAYAEESPLIILSGAPGINERKKNPLLHHKVKDFDTQKKIFENITIESVILDNPQTAMQEINRILSIVFKNKKPVYIELPRDITFQTAVCNNTDNITIRNIDNNDSKVYKNLEVENQSKPSYLYNHTDQKLRKKAIQESLSMINSSKMPLIIAGIEIQRFDLQKKLLQLIDKTNIPFVSTISSKSVLDESHPLFLGVYEGAMGSPDVRQYVESSDCVILLGAPMTETDFYITSTPITELNCINVASTNVFVKNRKFKVHIQDYLDLLIGSPLTKRDKELKHLRYAKNSSILKVNAIQQEYSGNKKISINRLFDRINSLITKKTIVITDTGDSLFGSLDLKIKDQSEFLASAYYLSMGFAIPASLGAQLANPSLRPIVIVGDGAFQMTGMEISTIARFNPNPIIFILNNKGYGTERQLLDGSFNDVLPWNYSLLPNVIGQGKGFLIKTERQLDKTLNEIQQKYFRDLCILDIRLEADDRSNAIVNLTRDLQKNIK